MTICGLQIIAFFYNGNYCNAIHMRYSTFNSKTEEFYFHQKNIITLVQSQWKWIKEKYLLTDWE